MMRKTILITGASSGIGQATALHFHSRGWNVVATMRKPEAAGPLQGMKNIAIEALDVTDDSSIAKAVQNAVDRFGKIDVLLNNAGYGAYGVLEATPMEKIRRQFDTNVIGLLAVTKAVLPHFRQNKDGIIINIASMGGKITFPLGTLYHGTKFAVEGLSEALSFELRPIGIRVKIIEPGMIATEFGGRSFDFSNDETLLEYQPIVQSLLQGFTANTAIAAPPSAVAEVIYSAASDGSDQLRYVAGTDAQEFIDQRAALGDEAFVRAMADRFAG